MRTQLGAHASAVPRAATSLYRNTGHHDGASAAGVGDDCEIVLVVTRLWELCYSLGVVVERFECSWTWKTCADGLFWWLSMRKRLTCRLLSGQTASTLRHRARRGGGSSSYAHHGELQAAALPTGCLFTGIANRHNQFLAHSPSRLLATTTNRTSPLLCVPYSSSRCTLPCRSPSRRRRRRPR